MRHAVAERESRRLGRRRYFSSITLTMPIGSDDSFGLLDSRTNDSKLSIRQPRTILTFNPVHTFTTPGKGSVIPKGKLKDSGADELFLVLKVAEVKRNNVWP